MSSRIIGNTRERVGPIVNFKSNFKDFVEGDLVDSAQGMYTDVRQSNNLKPIVSSMSQKTRPFTSITQNRQIIQKSSSSVNKDNSDIFEMATPYKIDGV